MKALLLTCAILLLAAPCSLAADTAAGTPGETAASSSFDTDADIAALKSFGAWYIKNRDHVDGIQQAFLGWLADPAVPDNLKIAGLERRQDMENALSKLSQFREQADRSMEDLAKDAASAAGEAKSKVEEYINNWLDKAISGESHSGN